MAKLTPNRFRAFDSNGDPLAGGKLYTFEAGTTTPKTSFTSADESTPNTNPVILDADGYADVWLADGSYKLRLDDANDVTLWTIDDVTGDATSAFGSQVISQTTSTIVNEVFNQALFICDGTLTLSLIPAADAGSGFYFTVKNQGSGTVTIDPDAAETIDGLASLNINPGESALVITNGTTWFTCFKVVSNTATLPDGTPVSDDLMQFADISDSNNNKKATIAEIIGAVVPTGTVLDYFGASAPTGWLFPYGQTIGNVGSGADVESADLENLFNNQKLLPFGSNTGTEDFLSGDTVTIADLRGRVPAGKDDMGGVAASRITNSGTGNPGIDGTTLGASGGTDRVTLTQAQLAAHTHEILPRLAGNTAGVGNFLQGAITDASYGSASSGSTGSSSAHANAQPTIIVNKIIKK